MRSWLSGLISKHISYVEAFCGAGHLLFAKEPSQVEVINDIDNHLINFFKVIRDAEARQRLIDMLDHMPYSRSLWQEIRTNWKKGNIPGDPVEASAQWYYLNRSTYGADMRRGGFAVPSVTGRNTVASFRNAIETFGNVALRLRNVCIENLNYRECILRYDSEDTLFYCDPPYLGSEYYYSKDSFTQDDHYKLAKLLHGVKGKAMVSHYQNGLYDELYKGWYRYEYSSFKGSHKSEGESKPKTVECLWTNFEPVGMEVN
ncbi:MAG: DNA adenine methylase [Candidatus Brocadia sinica]|nr:DNA adenine methylase [Candidatus Brocadia sinica]NUO06924.1 DNA adenine methylase [Candidatus Brocadia sinica]